MVNIVLLRGGIKDKNYLYNLILLKLWKLDYVFKSILVLCIYLIYLLFYGLTFTTLTKLNKYYVDLIPSIIDVYNKELFCIVDNIQSIELDF